MNFDISLRRDVCAARADEDQFALAEIGAKGIEHMLAEGAGKTLFGAKHHQPGATGSFSAVGTRRRREGQRLADGGGNRLGVAVHGGELVSRSLRPRRRYAPHGVDHRAELTNAVDARPDVGEPFGHGGPPAKLSA